MIGRVGSRPIGVTWYRTHPSPCGGVRLRVPLCHTRGTQIDGLAPREHRRSTWRSVLELEHLSGGPPAQLSRD